MTTTPLAHRRAVGPRRDYAALANGHLRTALGDVRWQRARVVGRVQYDADKLRALNRIRLDYGLLFHTAEEAELFGMYLMSTGQTEAAVALCEAWERNPHRPR